MIFASIGPGTLLNSKFSLVCMLMLEDNLMCLPDLCLGVGPGACAISVDFIFNILFPCVDEGVELGPGSLDTLGAVSRGDLRRAITSLQSAVRLKVSNCESYHN